MSNHLTHDYVEEYFKAQGCQLLETYTKSNLSMKYICKCGNESKCNWNNFMRGRRCQFCLVDKRKGENNYQWRSDREGKHLEYRWRQVAYRVLKQIGRKPECSVLLCREYFGYTIEEFKNHIKSQPGYTLDGDWVIDHIYPVWAFVESGVCDLRIINSLENLKVVLKTENSEKCYKFNPVAFVCWLCDKGACDATKISGI